MPVDKAVGGSELAEKVDMNMLKVVVLKVVAESPCCAERMWGKQSDCRRG